MRLLVPVEESFHTVVWTMVDYCYWYYWMLLPSVVAFVRWKRKKRGTPCALEHELVVDVKVVTLLQKRLHRTLLEMTTMVE